MSNVVFKQDDKLTIETSQSRKANEVKRLRKQLSKLSQDCLKVLPWLGILAPESPVSLEFMARLWHISPNLAYEILENFSKSSFITKSSTSLNLYSISEAAHALASKAWDRTSTFKENFSIPSEYSVSDAHAHLLSLYFQLAPNALWHCIPDDGYFQAHFLWHLLNSGRDDILHSLLQEVNSSGNNGWFSTCKRQGRIDLFIAALKSAQSSAKRLFRESPTRALSLQCHYALMYAAVIQQIESLPVQWFGALLRAELWTPDQVLFYIQVLRDPQQKTKAIQASAHHLPTSHIPPLLNLIGELKSDSAKAAALKTIAPHLPPTLMPKAFASICDISDEFYKSLAFSAFIPFWPQSMIPDVLHAILRIEDEFARIQVLQKWVPCLPNNLLLKVYAASINIVDLAERVNILILLRSRGLRLQAEIEYTLLQINNPIERDKYRVRLAQQDLTDSVDILKLLESLHNSFDLAHVIHQSASHLSHSMVEEVWQIAINIPNELDRVIAVNALIETWPNFIAPKISPFILQLQDIDAICLLMTSVVKFLSKENLLEIVKIASLSMDLCAVSMLWVSIAKVFPEFLYQSIEVSRQIQNIETRLEIFICLLPLCRSLQGEAFSLTLNTEDEEIKAWRISQLAQYLDHENRIKALKTALSMKSRSAQEIALQGIANYLSKDELSWGLEMIASDSILCSALNNLSKQFTAYSLEANVNDSKTIKVSIKNLKSSSTFLSKSYSNKSVSLSLLQTVLKIQEPFQRAKVLRGILHELEDVRITEALWNEILEALLKGHGLDFIKSMPLLIPAILNLSGISTLSKIPNSCHQISQQWNFSIQNKHDTFDKDVIPESLA